MPLTVSSLFTDSGGTPATGLTLTDIDMTLYSRAKSTGALVQVWNALNPTEEIPGAGIYTRRYAAGDVEDFDYYAFAEYTGVAVLDSVWSLQTSPTCIGTVDVWINSFRSLVHPITELRLAQQGNDIPILRGDTMDFDLSRLGNITGFTNIWFTVKDDKDLTDTGAIIQIDEDTGLLVINSATASVAANGSIVVTDAAQGNLTITLAAVEAQKLTLIGSAKYDIQWIDAAGIVATLVIGRASVIGDLTRRIT